MTAMLNRLCNYIVTTEKRLNAHGESLMIKLINGGKT